MASYGEQLAERMKKVGCKSGKVIERLLKDWNKCGWLQKYGPPTAAQMNNIVCASSEKLMNARQHAKAEEEEKKSLFVCRPHKKALKKVEEETEAANEILKFMSKDRMEADQEKEAEGVKSAYGLYPTLPGNPDKGGDALATQWHHLVFKHQYYNSEA